MNEKLEAILDAVGIMFIMAMTYIFIVCADAALFE